MMDVNAKLEAMRIAIRKHKDTLRRHQELQIEFKRVSSELIRTEDALVEARMLLNDALEDSVE